MKLNKTSILTEVKEAGKNRKRLPVDDPRGLYLYTNPYNWYVRLTVNGRQVERKIDILYNSDCTNLQAVRACALAKIDALQRGDEVQKTDCNAKISFNALWKIYKNITEAEGKELFYPLRTWLSRYPYPDRPLASITKNDWQEWQADLLAQGRKASYVNRLRVGYKQLLHWGIKNNVLPSIPKGFTDCPKLPEKGIESRQTVIADEDYSVIMDAVAKLSPKDYRRYFIPVLAETGMRPGELLALTWEGIDRRNLTVTIGAEYTKRGKAMTYSILPHTEAILKDWQTICGNTSGWVWYYDRSGGHDNSRRITDNRHSINALLKGINPAYTRYVFRHTLATSMAEHNATAPEIAAVLGHASMRTSERYITQTQKLQKSGLAKIAHKINNQQLADEDMQAVAKRLKIIAVQEDNIDLD